VVFIRSNLSSIDKIDLAVFFWFAPSLTASSLSYLPAFTFISSFPNHTLSSYPLQFTFQRPRGSHDAVLFIALSRSASSLTYFISYFLYLYSLFFPHSYSGPEGLPMLDPETKKSPPNLAKDYGEYIRPGHGFAGVFPEHKYLIVQCLREMGFKTGECDAIVLFQALCVSMCL
jgi:hypothetical protein